MKIFAFLSNIGGGSGTEINVVDDYTALLASPPTADTFYWCQNSQGTAWLPGSLGGTYYPKGMYYCFTTSPLVIEYVETPYQATQADVDAGTITDQFVSPKTFNDSAQLAAKVPTIRELTINGTTQDLTADRTWTVAGTLPAGGTAGQILTKVDSVDYNATWQENYADWTSVVKHTVKNDGVALITKGTPVYVTGSNGTNMLVGKASNTSEATSSKTMGLMQSDITTTGSTQTGFVITEGLLSGLDTSGRTAGEPIWLGPNGTLIYGLANKPYAPAHLVFIGIVTKVSAGSGEIFIKVQNGFELKEIHDVDIITTTPINGHILGFDGTLWVNKTIATWLGFTPVTDARTISTTAPLSGGGDLTANRTLSITQSTTSTDGYLSSTDWNTFNNKLSATITSVLGGDTLEYNSTTSAWVNSRPYWTVELIQLSTIDFYTTRNVIIDSITNIVGSPTITILDDGITYTLGNSIAANSKITVSTNIQSVVKLNIRY